METVLTWPFESNLESVVKKRLESMLQMEIENDGDMLELGEVSPIEIHIVHPETSSRKLRGLDWQSAEAPTSGTTHE